MAKALEEIKELFSKGKKKEERTVDIDELLSEEIVRRVLERYREEGEYIPEEEEIPESIEDIITMRTIASKTATSLEEHPSPVVRFLGGIYERMRGIVDRVAERLVDNRLMRRIDLELYSANIPLTAAQFVGLVLTVSILAGVLTLIVAPILLRGSTVLLLSTPIIAILVFFLVFLLGMSYPSRKARARGVEIEKELPFALRHLAVVIRSGMSLYNAMESIASSDYGVLSEEFRRTLREISEGKTTEEALESLALRAKSRGMRRTVSQIIRALRIGGNLSDAIRRIAEDLAYEQRMRVREFSEKLNLVGVVFMFVGIVFPTLMAILTGIGNAPLGTNLLAAFAMPPSALMTIYWVAIPAFMLIIITFVRKADPLGG